MRFTRIRSMAFVTATIVATASVRAEAQAAPPAPDAKKADVTGKWAMAVESEAGSGSPMITFKQAGDSISGQYLSQTLGTRDFTGTIKDGKLTFGFTADVGGQQFTMDFSGTLDGSDAMKGSIEFGGGLGAGTFTAKRVKAPPK